MSIVVDATVAIAWYLEDEASPETDAIAERVRNEGAHVPSLWHLQLGNVLIQAEKRGRITAADLTSRLELIGTLPIVTDLETSNRTWRKVLALAHVKELTTYNAAYLELAMRRGLPLASRDAALTAAAKSWGLEVLCERQTQRIAGRLYAWRWANVTTIEQIGLRLIRKPADADERGSTS